MSQGCQGYMDLEWIYCCLGLLTWADARQATHTRWELGSHRMDMGMGIIPGDT